MPTAWDGSNLSHNLDVFQSLLKAPQGTKVSFDVTSGQFSIQSPGPLQTLARTFSRDSVESQEFFARPVTGLFQEARRKIGHGVTQTAFDDALAGLKGLRTAYGDAGQAGKLVALDQVIKAVHLVGEPNEFAAFRQKYRRHLVYGFSMSGLLRPNDVGICQAMTIDWARRILAGKGSYAVSKKRSQPYDARPEALSGAEQARMLRKVETRLNPLQAALDEKKSVDYRDIRHTLEKFAGKFEELITGRVNKYDQQHAIRPLDTGGDILWDAVNHCGEDGVSIVLLLGIIKVDRAEGHALGVHRQKARLALFDPNVGEFSFAAPPAEKDDFQKFGDDLWKGLYLDKVGGQTFRGWDVIQILG
jgi:hypothetical protein